LRAIRRPVDAWQAELAPGLAVDVDKQVLLARVAAGLRWSNIAREEPARHLAFFYAAWMARDYVQRFWRDFWKLADERFAPTVSIPRALPRDWSVRWLPDDYHTELPPKPALLLARARLEGSGFATLCQGFTSSGLRDVWGRDTFDDGEKEVFLLPFPVLDDMWTLWLWVAALDGRRLHESWSAMCSYTGDVRLGLWPDETDPECAPQAVYRALVQRNLHQGVRDRTRFVTEALTFCSHVAEQLEAGARLGRDDLFGGQPDLGRYVRILRGDHQRYQTDLASGGRFWAHLPSSTEAPGIPHTASLLALAFPTATLFDYWARHDPEAPDGVGYDLLLVEDWTGTVWLSADPEKGKHLQLGFVAHHLTGLERKACGADAQTWYDGADHWGTLVRSPMRGGALSWDVFMDALGELLVLEPIR